MNGNSVGRKGITARWKGKGDGEGEGEGKREGDGWPPNANSWLRAWRQSTLGLTLFHDLGCKFNCSQLQSTPTHHH